MTKILFALFMISSLSTAYAEISFSCFPSLGEGKEIYLEITSEYTVASMQYSDSLKKICDKAAVSGELVEEGRSELSIACNSGNVRFIQNYDELTLDISSMKLEGENLYLCSQN